MCERQQVNGQYLCLCTGLITFRKLVLLAPTMLPQLTRAISTLQDDAVGHKVWNCSTCRMLQYIGHSCCPACANQTSVTIMALHAL